MDRRTPISYFESVRRLKLSFGGVGDRWPSTARQAAERVAAFHLPRWLNAQNEPVTINLELEAASRWRRLAWLMIGMVAGTGVMLYWLAFKIHEIGRTKEGGLASDTTVLALYSGHDERKPKSSIAQWADAATSARPVLILRLGLRSLAKTDYERFGIPRDAVTESDPWPVTVFRLMKAVRDFLEFWRASYPAYANIAWAMNDFATHKSVLRLAVQYARGFCHWYWCDQAVAHGTAARVVFPMDSSPDALMLDLALQNKGVRTFNYLHGQVHEPMYYISPSSYIVPWSQTDANILRETRAPVSISRPCNPHAVGRDELLNRWRNWSPDSGEVWVLSNYIHPDTPLTKPLHAERELLDVVRAAFKSLDLKPRVRYRPHPYAYRSEFFSGLASLSEEFGFQLTSEGIASAHQSSLLVCSLSTVVVDVLASGALPLVFVPEWQSSSPYARHLPVGLKFSNSDELVDRIEKVLDGSLDEEAFTQVSVALGLMAESNIFELVKSQNTWKR